MTCTLLHGVGWSVPQAHAEPSAVGRDAPAKRSRVGKEGTTYYIKAFTWRFVLDASKLRNFQVRS